MFFLLKLRDIGKTRQNAARLATEFPRTNAKATILVEPLDTNLMRTVRPALTLMLAAAAFLDANLPEEAAGCFDALDWKLAQPNADFDQARKAPMSPCLDCGH